MFGRPGSESIAASEAESKERYEEIVSLLVAAGYFRARIPALSPFDKVVGGMAWCMTVSSVDVDVAFQENATIGQKIKIGETIERALRRMKCRIPLQAHQIQGLDYAAIFPVVQWLVKQAYAVRDEIADAMRRLSTSQFARNYELPSDAELAARRELAVPAAQSLSAEYAPRRKFRLKGSASRPAAALHARRVLMEFGAQVSALAAAGAGAGAPSDADADADGRKASPEMSAALQAELAEAEGGGAEAELSQSQIGMLVHMGAEEIAAAAALFDKKSEALSSSGEMAQARRTRAEREAAEREVAQLRRQLGLDEQSASAAGATTAGAQARVDELRGAIDELAARRAQLEAEAAELGAGAARVDPEVMRMLTGLVAQNEQLGSQKKEFKRSCAAQLAELKRELEAQRAEEAGSDDEMRKIVEIEKLHEAETSRADKMRRLLGQKGREISALARQADDVPGSAELLQYERRFRELYAQVAGKLDETKRYFALYNTLEEKKGYLTKEVSLLNSIHDNFSKASSSANKEKLVESVEGLTKSVSASLQKVETRLADETAARDEVQGKYDKLVERQRRYFQLVKDYQTEAQRNEQLSATAAG